MFFACSYSLILLSLTDWYVYSVLYNKDVCYNGKTINRSMLYHCSRVLKPYYNGIGFDESNQTLYSVITSNIVHNIYIDGNVNYRYFPLPIRKPVAEVIPNPYSILYKGSSFRYVWILFVLFLVMYSIFIIYIIKKKDEITEEHDPIMKTIKTLVVGSSILIFINELIMRYQISSLDQNDELNSITIPKIVFNNAHLIFHHDLNQLVFLIDLYLNDSQNAFDQIKLVQARGAADYTSIYPKFVEKTENIGGHNIFILFMICFFDAVFLSLLDAIMVFPFSNDQPPESSPVPPQSHPVPPQSQPVPPQSHPVPPTPPSTSQKSNPRIIRRDYKPAQNTDNNPPMPYIPPNTPINAYENIYHVNGFPENPFYTGMNIYSQSYQNLNNKHKMNKMDASKLSDFLLNLLVDMIRHTCNRSTELFISDPYVIATNELFMNFFRDNISPCISEGFNLFNEEIIRIISYLSEHVKNHYLNRGIGINHIHQLNRILKYVLQDVINCDIIADIIPCDEFLEQIEIVMNDIE